MQELKKFESLEELNEFINVNIKKITVIDFFIFQEKTGIELIKFNYCYHLWYSMYDEEDTVDEKLLTFEKLEEDKVIEGMSDCCVETIDLVKSKVKKYNGVQVNCSTCHKQHTLNDDIVVAKIDKKKLKSLR